LLLFEPLISEIYYKNFPKQGKRACKDKILWLKSLPKKGVYSLKNRDAINAGEIKVRFLRYNLSLVDCFLLSVGMHCNATLLTTDHSVRDVARKMNIKVDFLPLFKK
jgi:predicted nucleic acid-binding protein